MIIADYTISRDRLVIV